MEGYVCDEVHPLIITWGVSDSDSWIVIRDRGPGSPGLPSLHLKSEKAQKTVIAALG